MCHHFDRVSWEERAESEEETQEKTEEWQPDEFSDEPAEDVEVLADGGESE